MTPLKFGTAAKVAAIVAATALPLAACSGNGEGEATDAAQEEVVVFAAASTEGAFTEIAETWEEDGGADITFQFGGSNGLVDQIAEGAPADILVTADTRTMDRAVEEGLVEEPEAIATNSLVLALAPGNPGGIETLEDALASSRLVICDPEVPCGNATATLFELLGVAADPASLESSVSDVRGKIESGEADAGVVYQTDAKAAGLDTIELPRADEVVTTVWSARIAGSDAPTDFLEHLRGEDAREVMDSYGFQP